MNVIYLQEPVSLSSDINECSLKARLYSRDAATVNITLGFFSYIRFNLKFSERRTFDYRDAALFFVYRVDYHLLIHDLPPEEEVLGERG